MLNILSVVTEIFLADFLVLDMIVLVTLAYKSKNYEFLHRSILVSNSFISSIFLNDL